MSNIFGSSLLYFVLELILACSLLRYLLWPSILFATPRESVMLDCGFSPLMSSLSDRNMRLGDALLPPGIKQRCMYLRVQGLFTLRKVLLMQLFVALSLHLGWDSLLNTSEMFWIDISRWSILSIGQLLFVYLASTFIVFWERDITSENHGSPVHLHITVYTLNLLSVFTFSYHYYYLIRPKRIYNFCLLHACFV